MAQSIIHGRIGDLSSSANRTVYSSIEGRRGTAGKGHAGAEWHLAKSCRQNSTSRKRASHVGLEQLLLGVWASVNDEQTLLHC